MLPAADDASALEPGDVLVIDPEGKLQRAAGPYVTNLTGVYSTKPGFVGDLRVRERGTRAYDEQERENETERWVPVALMGVVPVKVNAENGPIRPGELLTTSATPGHAMHIRPMIVNERPIYPAGVILGKALGTLESGLGVIRVLVSLG